MPLTVGHVLGEPFVTADEPLATFAAAHPVPTPAWAGVASRMAGGSAGWMPPSTLTMPAFSGGSRTPSSSGLSSSVRVSKPAGGLMSSPFDLSGLIGGATGGRVLRRDEGFVPAGSCETCPETEECYTIMDGVCREVPCDSDLCACGPCERWECEQELTAPSATERSTGCEDDGQVEGSNGTCSPLACDIERTVSDFTSLSTSWIDEVVNIDDDFSTSEQDLLRHAWALLVANTELVDWAVCWVTGNSGAGDCLLNRINGVDANVNLKHVSSDSHHFYVGPLDMAVPPLYGGTIRIYENWPWDRYIDIWNSGDTCNQLCSALDLACTLLHKLTHVCWRAWNDESSDCDSSYLVENVFRWAMYRRYPDALQSECCSYPDLGGDWVFGDDAGHYPERECLDSAESSSSASADAEALAAAKEDWLEHKGDKPGESIASPERK